MGAVVNIQLSAFCNNRIEPNAKNIALLMEKINSLNIKEYLPNIATSQSIDLVKGNIETSSNLGFVTTDKSGQIMCQDNRIDCIFNYQNGCQGCYEKDIDNLRDILSLILSEYEIISNRLAININILSDSYNGNLQNTNFGQNIVSTLDFYKGKELREWSSRDNLRYPIKIGDKEEMLNVITELSMVISQPEREKRLLCHMDINTIPENIGYRFNYEKMLCFVSEVKKVITDIKNNFEELSNNAEK